VLAWGARKAGGGDVESLRLLSVLFAAAAAALTSIWALRLLDDPLAAGLTGLLVALGSAPVQYAEQLRAYALVVLMAVMFGMVLVEAALRPKARLFVGLAACAWVGALTHYFFLFVVAAGLVWLWIARPRPVAAGRATVAIGVGMLAFAPWLPAFHEQEAHGRYRWIGGFDPTAVVKLPGELFFGPDGLLFGIARLAVTVALIGGVVVLSRQREGCVVVALGLLPIAAAAGLWAAGAPIFNERNMLPVVPFLAIAVAATLRELPPRLLTAGALVGIAATVAGAAYAQATLGRVAYDSVARTITDFGWTAGDAVVVGYLRPSGDRRGVGIQIASPLGWYLPGRPDLVWSPARRGCRVRFAVEQVPDAQAWLARYDGRVSAARIFAYYDHPILGRPRDKLVVVRFHSPTRVSGAFFYAVGRKVSCRSGAASR
jgi:hypothetical protein